MSKNFDYVLSIDLNSLNHLGIGLYSNTPAVLSEVVANSWDADAKKVEISINASAGVITISDDGFGMTKQEINGKYLRVGYAKRESEPTLTPSGRHVMGRKGIGKLSLFSIADTIEVHSVKLGADGKISEKSGFIMNADKIKAAIQGQSAAYNPDPVNESKITIKKGTTITLRDLKKEVHAAEAFLRKRLARRFSILGADYNFAVVVNGKPISVQDRDYFEKIEYVWYFSDESKTFGDYCKFSKRQMQIDGIVDLENDYRITGWVGTFDEQKSIEEGNNTVVVLAWGKLIHEDLLKDVKAGGVFTKYLIGEIRADFLDSDDKIDIVTSDRQNLKESDPRFLKLKTYFQDHILNEIQNKWRDWRNQDAEKKALENPAIKEWFETLTKDNKKYARILFSKIEAFPIQDTDYKRELYKHGIIAFETLALKDNLSALDKISTPEDFETFTAIFTGIDELEAAHYYQVVKGRLAVLRKFETIVPKAKEKVIQAHIFDHLWLLHPSWERASTDEKVEKSVYAEFKKLEPKMTKEEKAGRIDIRYRTAAGKHIIIELKKYDRVVKIEELIKQVQKYRGALQKCLVKAYQGERHVIEIICILGNGPKPQDQDEQNREMLKALDARYLTYDGLILQTRESYRDYLESQKKISRIQQLIESI